MPASRVSKQTREPMEGGVGLEIGLESPPPPQPNFFPAEFLVLDVGHCCWFLLLVAGAVGCVGCCWSGLLLSVLWFFISLSF